MTQYQTFTSQKMHFQPLIYLIFSISVFFGASTADAQIVNLGCQTETEATIDLDRKNWNGGSTGSHSQGSMHNFTLPTNIWGSCKKIGNLQVILTVNGVDQTNMPADCPLIITDFFINMYSNCGDFTPASCDPINIVDEFSISPLGNLNLNYTSPPEDFPFDGVFSFDIVPVADTGCSTGQTMLSSNSVILDYEVCVIVTIEDVTIQPVDLGNDRIVCTDQFPQVLDAGSYDSYIWSPNGEMTQMINATGGGTYAVTVSDASGCTATDEIILTEPSIPITFNPMMPMVCGSDDVSVTVNESYLFYNWSNGLFGQTVNLEAGSYNVTVLNMNGCSEVGTIEVTSTPALPATFASIPSQCVGEPNPLPIVSLEGFTGTWSPAFDPSTTTNYTFTPTAGQCATNGMATVAIDAETPATFAAIPSQCVGEPNPLPMVSIEGFTGTWAPAFDPNTTTNYTFTPDPGQCATNGMATVTIDAETPATFATIPSQCQGESNPLPIVSLEGFTGTWSPAFDPNNTTNYNFTPDAGQCAANGMATVTIDAATPATFAAIPNQCQGESNPLPIVSLEGFTGTWSPAFDPNNTTNYTFTPDAGQCAANGMTTVTIDPATLPTFTQLGPYCVGDTPDMLSTFSLNGISGTWDGPIITSSSGATTYTFTPDPSECANSTTMQIQVDDCGCMNPATISINPISAICEDEIINLTSILGGSASMVTWSTVGDGTFDDINSNNPTYTPGASDIANGTVNLIATTDDPDGAGPCSEANANVVLTIDAEVTPNFSQLGSYCVGDTPDMLPTTSLNGISGTWDGPITTSTAGATTYTFTPDPSECAEMAIMNITVVAPQMATFDAITSQCQGEGSPLPTLSLEGFTGTWSPTFDPENTATYTFTPTATQCAANGMATVTIEPATLPTFTQLGPYCVDDSPDMLPLISNNGISGTWDGPIVTTSSGATTYTFSPAAAECANSTTMQIQVNDCGCADPATVSINPIAAICEDETINLSAILGGTATMLTWSTNGDGTFDDVNSTTPIYTPGASDIANGSVNLVATTDDPDGAGPCSAASANTVLTINTQATPDFTQLGPYCIDDTPDILPLTSNNGISGTWDGAIVTASSGATTYTFTPAAAECASSTTMQIQVNDCGCADPATVSINPIADICEDETINLTSILGGSATMLTWSTVGDGTFDDVNSTTPTYTPGASDIANGSVNIMATTDDPDGAGPCSVASANTVLTINAQATPDFTQLGPYCIDDNPDILPLTSNNGISGTWDGPIVTASSGATTYIFIPAAAECASSTTMQIQVNDCGCADPATLSIDPISDICEDETINLTSILGGSATMLTWSTVGDGTFDDLNSTTPTYTPGASDIANGSVNIMATTDDPDGAGPCSAAISNVNLIINAEVVSTFAQLGPYCIDEAPDMLPTTSLNGITGTWDGQLFTNSAGITSFMFTPDDSECATTATMQIEVNDCGCPDPATVSINPISDICEDETIDLVAVLGGSASMVTWSTNGDGSFDNSNSNTPTYTPGTSDISSGSVNIIATTDDPDGAGPCSAANANIQLVINTEQDPTFTQLEPYCLGDTPDILPITSTNGITGAWDGAISTASVETVTFTFTPDIGQCATTATMLIEVNDCDCMDPAEIMIDPISTIDATETIQLMANLGGSATTVTWSSSGDGTFDDVNASSPTYTPGPQDISNGSVNLTATTNDPDGTEPCSEASATIELIISPTDQPKLNYPNAFSPNSDGINDYFTIYSSNGDATIVSLSIFDRHGNMVFSKSGFATNTQELAWDGRFNNTNVELGVYVFMATVVADDNQILNLIGDVTVVR